MTRVPPFDLDAALPTGRVTLEASAGTGKTYAIVGLATRYLAEGRATADQLLVVTFARSATRELRQRLLDRIASGLDVVDAALAGTAPADDDIDRSLVGGADQAELTRRRDRLAQALADIDLASISTIHGFCAESLARLGDALGRGDVGGGGLLDDERRFATEIAGDLYLRAATTDPGAAASLPYFDMFAPALAAAGIGVDPDRVRPSPSLSSWATNRAWIATEARAEAVRRKRRTRHHTHDDLLERLASRLTHHVHGADAAAICGDRFRVALVDEFQDTDPTQWQILSALFPDAAGDDGRSLVLVGDPKQAIYAFRGADVHAYTRVRGEQAAWTLATNRRSDRPLVDAVLALFTGQPLGRHIDVLPVDAANDTRLVGLDAPPVAVRAVPDDAQVRRTQSGAMQVTSLRDLVAADVARQASAILHADARIVDDDDEREVGPGDLAVLVRTRRQAALVQRHLQDVGIPSVVNGVGNVIASPAARDWITLLRAIDRPAAGGPARLAALTDLVGWTPADVLAADGPTPEPGRSWDDLHVALHQWRDALLDEGVAAALRHVSAQTGLTARLLARPDGQRRLTDLTHVAELLHVHGSRELLGTAGLVAWIEAEMAAAADPSEPTPPDHLALRLERDGDVVQIMTVHGAKGLEFGVVLAPFLWDVPNRDPIARDVHDPTTDRRLLYVGNDKRDPDHQRYVDLHTQQAEEEERRLAYVAATRARHHLRLWWAPGPCAATSPLGTLLARPREVRTTADATAAIDALAAAHPDLFAVGAVDPAEPITPVRTSAGIGADPVLARFPRPIDHGWRRSSYSRLVGDAAAAADTAPTGGHDVDSAPPVLGHPVEADAADDIGPTTLPPAAADPSLAVPVPLSDLRGGADIGTVVHAILEHVDFTAEDLADAVRRETIRQAARHAIDLGSGDPAVGDEAVVDASVVDGLVAAISTPLDAASGVRLRDIPRTHRLDEMAFEVPALGEGLADQAGRLLITDIADLLDAHLPADDPLAGYADVLRRHLPDTEVRGFLAGYVDLVARLPDGRVLVADYKTNRVAPTGTDPLIVGHFTQAALAAEMQHHHYPLQALFYLVAVHRYLRWRMPGYDPDEHLAGVAYLFVRGMVGPDTPVRDGAPCGVFRWRPPTPLLADVDRLLADGRDPDAREVP